MRYRTLIAGLAVCALASLPAELAAQSVATGFQPNPRRGITQVGTRGANFLRIGPDARARSLGDAGTALSQGAAALYYNPGSVGLSETFDATVSRTDLYGGSGITHSYVAAVVPAGQGAFGVQAIMFNSGDIMPTSEHSPQGSDPLLGESTQWRAVSTGLTYGRRITDRLAVGVTGKFVQEGIDFAKAQWVAVDVGTVFETGVYGIQMSMAVTHIGGESRFEGPAIYGSIDRTYRIFSNKILGAPLYFRYDTEQMQLPTQFRLGLQSQVLGAPYSVLGGAGGSHALSVLTEISDGFDADVDSRWGVEYSFRDVLFLRGGKHFQNEDRAPWSLTDGMSAGAGIRLPLLGRSIGIDYSYTSMGVLENVQTFSLRLGS